MIFGDSASGKSTFASKLGKKLDIPVIHLDEIMAKVGRDKKKDVLETIKTEVIKPEWIIEGNAFTKDKTERIAAADSIIVFDFNRFISLIHHIARSLRIRRGVEQQKSGVTGEFNLKYYIPYTLWRFPGRKQAAIERATASGKPVVLFHSRKDAEKYLVNMTKTTTIS